MEGRCFKVWFLFLSTLIWLLINKFPQAKSVLPVMVIGEGFFLAFILTQEPLVAFSPPHPASRPVQMRSDRAAFVGTWSSARVNPPTDPVNCWGKRALHTLMKPGADTMRERRDTWVLLRPGDVALRLNLGVGSN